jgi:cysteine desulfurase
VATEHKAVLDPLAKLGKKGFEITLLPVRANGHPDAGRIEIDRLAEAIRDDTVLVSVMLANNEIGVLQPLEEIGALCKQRAVLLHTDATQAVGKIPVHVDRLQVDLMSFSGHKIHGPKGIGALYVRRRAPQVRLESQIDGGRQEGRIPQRHGQRSGGGGIGQSLGVVHRRAAGRDRSTGRTPRSLVPGLLRQDPRSLVERAGLGPGHLRLAGNLNCCFGDVDGEALMMSMRDLAVSSGSACSSADPTPSHVLQALGLNADQTRASLRFGLSRFNTREEVDFAIEAVADAVKTLRQLHAG